MDGRATTQNHTGAESVTPNKGLTRWQIFQEFRGAHYLQAPQQSGPLYSWRQYCLLPRRKQAPLPQPWT